MSTECYAMVRGSAIRVTDLNRRGGLGDGAISYAVSKSVTSVQINEVTESGSNEIIRNDEDERRLHLVRSEQPIRYTVDINFIRVDPGMLGLVAGVSLVYGDAVGFGEGEFGLMPFGGGTGDVIGFDSNTRLPPKAFALEVWSRLAGEHCAEVGFDMGGFDEDGFGGYGYRRWGYTLFPFLKGGRLSGFKFTNGLVSFNLTGATTQRGSKWGIGPYDIDGPRQRLVNPVSGNVNWRTTIVSGAPPAQTDGVVEFVDVIDGGTATMTSDDVLDGEFAVTSSQVVDGGGAA